MGLETFMRNHPNNVFGNPLGQEKKQRKKVNTKIDGIDIGEIDDNKYKHIYTLDVGEARIEIASDILLPEVDPAEETV